jgi:hypothetical protein
MGIAFSSFITRLSPPAKKTIDLEGRLIKDGVRKRVKELGRKRSSIQALGVLKLSVDLQIDPEAGRPTGVKSPPLVRLSNRSPGIVPIYRSCTLSAIPWSKVNSSEKI